jgi:hypothetical protein
MDAIIKILVVIFCIHLFYHISLFFT